MKGAVFGRTPVTVGDGGGEGGGEVRAEGGGQSGVQDGGAE